MLDATVTVDGAGRAVVTGELDAQGCQAVKPGLLDALAHARRDGQPRVVADLSGVGFVASSALALLLELDAKATAADLVLSFVVAPDSTLDRQLQRTGVASVLTIHPPDEPHEPHEPGALS